MRAYSIEITDKNGTPVRPPSTKGANLAASYASFKKDDTPVPGALQIDLNIPLYNYAAPKQGGFVRIWGVSLAEIAQAADLTYFNITIKAGMKKGLPLAKPAQFGTILQGTIFQSFGNWDGINQSLDLTFIPPLGTNSDPANIPIDWKANTSLSSALKASLQTAFPKYTIKVAISDKLVLTNDQKGAYPSLETLAKAMLKLTMAPAFAGITTLSGAKYAGVFFRVVGTEITIYDGTSAYGGHTVDDPLVIQFEDMIGQPTWIGPSTINFKCVMRSDLNVGDFIQMPKSLATPYVVTTAGAAFQDTPARNQSTFKGKFMLIDVHHMGSSRQANASSWVTIFNAVATGK